MSKIHVFDMELREVTPPRTGTIRCAYHVDMRPSKDEDVVVPVNLRLPEVEGTSGGSTVSFGTNSALVGEGHPSFPGGATTEFTIPETAVAPLDNQSLPVALRDLFPPHGVTITQGATVQVDIPSSGWTILDDPYTHTITRPAPVGDLSVVGEIDQMEGVHISTYDLAEVVVKVTMSEADSTERMAVKVDRLYRVIQNVANTAYTEKYKFYGATRNPA